MIYVRSRINEFIYYFNTEWGAGKKIEGNKIGGKKAKAFLACIANIIYVCEEQAHNTH